jgi:hypothetical protein
VRGERPKFECSKVDVRIMKVRMGALLEVV